MVMGWCVNAGLGGFGKGFGGRRIIESEVLVYMYNIMAVLLSSWCGIGVGRFLHASGL